MSITTNPYGRKIPSLDYGSFFNLMFQYVEITKEQPNIYEFDSHVKECSMAAIENAGAQRIFVVESEKQEEGKNITSIYEACYTIKDAMVYFFRRENILNRIDYLGEGQEEDDDDDKNQEVDSDLFRCRILYAKRETLDFVLPLLSREPEKKKKGNVHLLCSADGMLMLQRFDVKLPSGGVDLELNYGEDAAAKFNKIAAFMAENKSGLVLFSGDPGTGKSTFIKYLTTHTSRKVIYLSSGAAEQIVNPDFLTFMMRNRNCILLLEDAEKVLRSRDSQDNSAISNILNITDGILGDCLNIMVVATFNINRENIDSALVRKGRLLVEHHFSALSEDAANKVLEKVDPERKASGSMTLAEIYNPESNYHEKEERRKVGF